MKSGKFIILLIIIASAYSCNNCKNKVVIKTQVIRHDSIKLDKIADSIVCDMIVRNTDPSDTWTEESLKSFDRKTFINNLFEDIYDGKLIAYDFETQQPLNNKQVKSIEKLPDYNREIIGKFQFREVWYYNRQTQVFEKKVQSIIFGYETYTEDSLVKGYKPMFKVFFN